MDPGLYREVDGQKKCLYGQDAAERRCEATCRLGTLSTVAAGTVGYKCTCVTNEAAKRGLKAQSGSFFWVGLYVMTFGIVVILIGVCLLQSWISSLSWRTHSANAYRRMEDATELTEQPPRSTNSVESPGETNAGEHSGETAGCASEPKEPQENDGRKIPAADAAELTEQPPYSTKSGANLGEANAGENPDETAGCAAEPKEPQENDGRKMPTADAAEKSEQPLHSTISGENRCETNAGENSGEAAACASKRNEPEKNDGWKLPAFVIPGGSLVLFLGVRIFRAANNSGTYFHGCGDEAPLYYD